MGHNYNVLTKLNLQNSKKQGVGFCVENMYNIFYTSTVYLISIHFHVSKLDDYLFVKISIFKGTVTTEPVPTIPNLK